MDPLVKAVDAAKDRNKKRCERTGCKTEVPELDTFYCPECKKNPLWPK